MKTSIDNLLSEVNKAGEMEDYTVLTPELGAKLALIQHALLHGTDQLRDEALAGISYLISEVQKGVVRMGEYSQKAQEYFHYLNDPEGLKKIQEFEMV